MKKVISICLLLVFSYAAVGEDIELYISDGVKQTAKRPQVLVIFDTSGSMRTNSLTVKKAYNPAIHYDPEGGVANIYYSVGDSAELDLPKVDDASNKRFFPAIYNNCETARTILAQNGFYTGHVRYYNTVGNTGRWSEIPTNDGSTITVLDCEDDVINENPDNNGIDPKTGSTFASSKQGYPVDSLGTSANPQYFISNKLQSNVSWTGQLVTLYTDNYLRWYHGDTSNAKIGSESKTRMEVAQQSLIQVVQSTPSIDFGLQVFNKNKYASNSGGKIISGIKDNMTSQDRTDYISKINNLYGNGWTPLCETLYEASLYFSGKEVFFGSKDNNAPVRDQTIEDNGSYISPFKGCGNNAFVILVTDGAPTRDTDADDKVKSLTALDDNGDPVSFNLSPYNVPSYGNNYLAALASWMNQYDINPNVEGKQTINTYTIGFGTGAADAEPLLKETAKLGAGKYFPAKNSQDLTKALIKTLQSLTPSNETLTSASVAANNFDRTQTSNYVYYSMFEPQSGPRWQGNLKKYKIVDDVAKGKSGKAVIDNSTGAISDDVTSYWSSSKDGSKVASGSVAEMLRNKSLATRTLYSDLNGGTSLSAYTIDNLKSAFGGISGLAAEMNVTEADVTDYINWSMGKNVDNVKAEDKSIPDIRPDVFGDPLHSKPLVFNYGSTTRVLIGTNAGVLHMFNDKGNEVDESWAFMPKEFIHNIPALRDNYASTDKVYGIDGKITTYFKDISGNGIVDGNDKVWIFFGLRRGGSSYYAMDISDPDAPKLMWHKDNTSDGFSHLGQSWSQPKVAYSKLKVSGDTASPVLFIGGGYDTAKDASGPGGNDSVGKTVYMLNAEDGSILWSLGDGGKTAFPGTDSIPSDIATLDSDSDGLTDRIYFGDTGGNVWRVDMPGSNTSKWTVFKLAALGGNSDASDRRFFSAPTVVRTFITETIETSVTDENGATTQIKVKQEKPYDAILIGSGDRTNPLGKDTDDVLFMIKDEHIKTTTFTNSSDPAIPAPITISDLYDYTNNPFGSYTPPLSISEKSALEQLSYNVSLKSGWYINLTKDGEKSTSTPVVIEGIVYFLSYTPPFIEANSASCTVPSGLGSIYIVDLALGIKKYNLTKLTNVKVRDSDDRVLDISHDWIDGLSLIVPPSSNNSDKPKGSLVPGYAVLPVGFQLQTMRTSLYVTED